MNKRATGARIFFECLRREGVDVVFGYPGGAVIQLYDELIRFPDIRHILVRHEQGAVHAADGFARSTGRVGVCLATSGPGATNLVTGLATAYLDSIPLVAFTGQVPTGQLGNDAFQEVDILGITRTCTKHNYMVRNTYELSTIIREAFWVAASGRPGPVLVDLPKDVMAGEASLEFPGQARPRGYTVPGAGHPLQIKRVAAEIRNAQKPVIYAGGGIIHAAAHSELRALAEATGIPVTLTLMGLGGFPASHPLFLGMLGMHGSYAANMAVTHSDLLVAIGCRFDDRVTGKIERFAPQARIIHIDIDPSSISKNVKVDVPIVGDAKAVLTQILKALGKDSGTRQQDRSAWMTKIRDYQDQHPFRYDSSSTMIKPQHIVEELCARTRNGAIIATEVGQNQMWTAQFFGFRSPRTLLSSGGLGTMGYGLPAAIGAQIACPDRTVIDIAGDASIQMNIQELGTAVQYGLPIKIAVLNNRSLGMVRQWQTMFFQGRLSETLLEGQPDFVRLAEAYGAVGLRATRPDEVGPCLERALALPGPVLMDFWVDPLEQVLPLVPPGSGIDEMILDTMVSSDGEGDSVTLPA